MTAFWYRGSLGAAAGFHKSNEGGGEMPTCNPYFWVSLFVALTGIVALVARGSRSKKSRLPAWRRLVQHPLMGVALVLGGGLLYATAVAAYTACTRALGACPAGFPPGSRGYVCTNEYVQCSWTGNCFTVAGSWPWDSACECKCTR